MGASIEDEPLLKRLRQAQKDPFDNSRVFWIQFEREIIATIELLRSLSEENARLKQLTDVQAAQERIEVLDSRIGRLETWVEDLERRS